VVATPIGNLEDVTLRALRVLREVNLIAAEDTRKSRRLLAAHDIHTPLTSYHEHNKKAKLKSLLDRLVDSDVALVSEAGMPGLSDPGYELILAAIAMGTRVVPVPGPSVVLTSLVVSGLPADQFTYLGFLPRKGSDRKRFLLRVAAEPRTMVAFEAPHRLKESLSDMLEVLGDRRVAVCREMTKVHEEVFRGSISDSLEHFAQPIGEFTLVIGGAEQSGRAARPSDSELVRQVEELCRGGIRMKEAVTCVALGAGVSSKELYAEVVKGSRSRPGQGGDRPRAVPRNAG